MSPDSGVEEDCPEEEAADDSEEKLDEVYSEIYSVKQPPLPVKTSTLRPPARPPYPASAAVVPGGQALQGAKLNLTR